MKTWVVLVLALIVSASSFFMGEAVATYKQNLALSDISNSGIVTGHDGGSSYIPVSGTTNYFAHDVRTWKMAGANMRYDSTSKAMVVSATPYNADGGVSVVSAVMINPSPEPTPTPSATCAPEGLIMTSAGGSSLTTQTWQCCIITPAGGPKWVKGVCNP